MKNNTNDFEKKIPMRELEKLTSMNRSTINYYIKEGILPLPQKSAKNMAYYDETFVEKLKLIEIMKKEHYSLAQIKKLINSESGTINDFCFQILESVNKLLPYGVDENLVTKKQLCDIGLDETLINELIEMNIIIPDNTDNTLFPAYSLTVCQFIKYFTDVGIPLPIVEEIINKLKELAYLEKDTFIDYIRNPMIDNHLSPEKQKTEVDQCILNINALLPILHLQFLILPTRNLLKSTPD